MGAQVCLGVGDLATFSADAAVVVIDNAFDWQSEIGLAVLAGVGQEAWPMAWADAAADAQCYTWEASAQVAYGRLLLGRDYGMGVMHDLVYALLRLADQSHHAERICIAVTPMPAMAGIDPILGLLQAVVSYAPEAVYADCIVLLSPDAEAMQHMKTRLEAIVRPLPPLSDRSAGN